MSQLNIWNEEHQNPLILLPMNSNKPSSGVVLFWDWWQKNHTSKTVNNIIEIGCGKGRNSIYLSKHGNNVTGFDFSSVAIAEAIKRSAVESPSKANFFQHDATKTLPLKSETFDIAIDCFASTDIDSYAGRCVARDELFRVLKVNGLLFVYCSSLEDEYHKELLTTNPAKEINSFKHPVTGKFEKVFGTQELIKFYDKFNIVEHKRIHKKANFFGKDYECKHHWLIFRKLDNSCI